MARMHAPQRSAQSPHDSAGRSSAQRKPGPLDHSPRMVAQARAIGSLFGAAGPAVAQLGKKDYPYGSADSVPHVHVYGPDSHLKIVGRLRPGLKRYNIVQNGKLHAQSGDALAEAQASGDADLIAVVQGLIDAV